MAIKDLLGESQRSVKAENTTEDLFRMISQKKTYRSRTITRLSSMR